MAVGRGIERGCFYIDDVANIGDNAVTQCAVGGDEGFLAGGWREVFGYDVLVVHDGTDLQEIEEGIGRSARTKVYGKFNLDGSPHFLLPDVQEFVQCIGEGEDLIAENVGKGEEFAPFRIVAVAYDLIGEIVGGNEVAERAVGIGFLDGKAQEVEGIINREIAGEVVQVKGVEAGLRFAQGVFGRACLQYVVRMTGREAQGLPAVHDVFAQPEGDAGDAVFRLFVACGVEVEGTGYAGDGRIETAAVGCTDGFLQDDGHLFLINEVGSCRHIGFAVLVKDRGIDGFDGIADDAEHLLSVFHLGYHIGGIDAGKGLIVRIFQQA
ncbi:hypothetical protein Barb7_03170 [Bacteroidales bacterium Barb7]|nr:hypothetical protein Barb7_03170 [Bacteroidales bacterium Barb7]